MSHVLRKLYSWLIASLLWAWDNGERITNSTLVASVCLRLTFGPSFDIYIHVSAALVAGHAMRAGT